MSERSNSAAGAAWLRRVQLCCPDAVDTRCREGQCRLATDQLNGFVIILGEKARRSEHPVCDCLVFVDATKRIIGLVELKSRTVDASHVADQLSGGVRLVLGILRAAKLDPSDFSYLPVVLCQACTTSERDILQRQRLDISGKRYDIIVRRCGASLGDIIDRLA